MHPSSFENMNLCYQRYVASAPRSTGTKAKVLDIGAANVNGSYRPIFAADRFDYVGVDLAAGDGVDIVLKDPYVLPFATGSFDIVISGQALEHAEFFWLIFVEMARVVRADGFIFLIAPSEGPIHRYPVDCYRFYPDAYYALSKYAKCALIDVWRDERGPWRDLVGVFRGPTISVATTSGEQTAPMVEDGANSVSPRKAAEELIQGARGYLDILADLHQELAPNFYIEIGVFNGDSLALARCSAVGVDPAPQINVRLPATTDVVGLTSDAFFAGSHKRWLRGSFDLAFVDGMHLFEFVLRDFINLERAATTASMVVFDDIYPNHPAQAERIRRTGAWTGDVWKFHDCLREYRPDLFLMPLDSSPAGTLIVCGLDPANRVLRDNYDELVKIYSSTETQQPPETVIARDDAWSGDQLVLREISGIMRKARTEKPAPDELVRRLRDVKLQRKS